MNDEPLYTVVTEDSTYIFTTADEFYNFMSENDNVSISRIEKHEN